MLSPFLLTSVASAALLYTLYYTSTTYIESATCSIAHPATTNKIATILTGLTVSPKYQIPIREVRVVPTPLHIAYAVDSSIRLSDSGIKMNEHP